jgi:hypothetical protein
MWEKQLKDTRIASPRFAKTPLPALPVLIEPRIASARGRFNFPAAQIRSQHKLGRLLQWLMKKH